MQNKDHISYQVALNIKQAVEEKTEGRVLIDIYPANQLGDWSQVYDELMMGSIDMAHSSVPETYDARTAVGYFPYLSSSYDQLGEIFAEGSSLDNMMKEIQAKNGIEFCGFFVEGIAGIGTTKEVSNPNTLDSKNTVIRTAAIHSRLISKKTLKAGSRCLNMLMENDRVIGVIPFGSCDGFSTRNAGGEVLLNGVRCKILAVCLEHTVLDITNVPDAEIGDVVTLLGQNGESRIDVSEYCERLGISVIEFWCSLSFHSFPHIYVREGQPQEEVIYSYNK